MAKHLNVIANI